MANEIQQKYGSLTSFTITLASLGSSSSFVGRQSTLVTNSTTKYEKILIHLKVKQGTSPASNKGVYVYFLRGAGDGTMRDDNAGASDAALTIKNAEPIGAMLNGTSPSTGDVLSRSFVVYDPGPEWGIAIYQDTGVNLDSTEGNHYYKWIGVLPEVQ